MSFTVTLAGSSTLATSPATVSLILTNGEFDLQSEAGLQVQGFSNFLGLTMTLSGVFLEFPASTIVNGSLTLFPNTGAGQPPPVITLEGASGGSMTVTYPTATEPKITLHLLPYEATILDGYQA